MLFNKKEVITKEEAISLLSKDKILDKVARNKKDFENQYNDMFIKSCKLISNRIESAIKNGHKGAIITKHAICLPEFAFYEKNHKRMISEIEEVLKRDYDVKVDRNGDGSFYKMDIILDKETVPITH